jgi:hypothetical protein
MTSDITSLESQLGRLRPSAPSAALLDRLEACAAGVWQQSTRIEQAAAESLAAHAPAPLPAALAESLLATLSKAEFPQESKIVPFPAKDASDRRAKPAWLSAVALVALCGVLTALLVPVSEKPTTVAAAPTAPATSAKANKSELLPAGFRRGLSEASDEGVVWQSPNSAHRVLRVVYKDTVTMRDNNGRIYQIEEPRVEYILVPAKID